MKRLIVLPDVQNQVFSILKPDEEITEHKDFKGIKFLRISGRSGKLYNIKKIEIKIIEVDDSTLPTDFKDGKFEYDEKIMKLNKIKGS